MHGGKGPSPKMLGNIVNMVCLTREKTLVRSPTRKFR